MKYTQAVSEYLNQELTNNHLVILERSEKIKNICSNLNSGGLKYQELPEIKKSGDLGPWVRFGKDLINKFSSNEINKCSESREIVKNYLEMANFIKRKYFRDVALEVSKSFKKCAETKKFLIFL